MGVVHIFLTIQSPCYSFSTAPLPRSISNVRQLLKISHMVFSILKCYQFLDVEI